MDQYQQYIHKSRYARYLDDENKRNMGRNSYAYVSFWGNELSTEDKGTVYSYFKYDALYALHDDRWSRLSTNNVAGFNCSYLPIDSPRSFDELMYILQRYSRRL